MQLYVCFVNFWPWFPILEFFIEFFLFNLMIELDIWCAWCVWPMCTSHTISSWSRILFMYWWPNYKCRLQFLGMSVISAAHVLPGPGFRKWFTLTPILWFLCVHGDLYGQSFRHLLPKWQPDTPKEGCIFTVLWNNDGILQIGTSLAGNTGGQWFWEQKHADYLLNNFSLLHHCF